MSPSSRHAGGGASRRQTSCPDSGRPGSTSRRVLLATRCNRSACCGAFQPMNRSRGRHFSAPACLPGQSKASQGPQHTGVRVPQNAGSRARGARPSDRPGEGVPPAAQAESQPPPPRGSGANQACHQISRTNTRSPDPTSPNQPRKRVRLLWRDGGHGLTGANNDTALQHWCGRRSAPE